WRIGLEYLWKDWAFRVGYVHDESPIPDETLDFMVPADDRDLYNFGIGYSHGNFTIDGAYTYLVIDDRDVSANDNIHRPRGELHDGYAHMFSISLGYKF
ncbi:MAG: transporter, partial [Deltaproteobacteria bacterium]